MKKLIRYMLSERNMYDTQPDPSDYVKNSINEILYCVYNYNESLEQHEKVTNAIGEHIKNILQINDVSLLDWTMIEDCYFNQTSALMPFLSDREVALILGSIKPSKTIGWESLEGELNYALLSSDVSKAIFENIDSLPLEDLKRHFLL